MQVAEPPPREIVLTGWRRILRQGALGLVVITAGLTALVAPPSPIAAPLGIVIAIGVLLLAVSAGRAMRRPFPSGIRIGLLGVLGSVVALLVSALVLHGHEGGRTSALLLTMIGLAALLGAGLLLIAIELVTHHAERARLRREFPTARVGPALEAPAAYAADAGVTQRGSTRVWPL